MPEKDKTYWVVPSQTLDDAPVFGTIEKARAQLSAGMTLVQAVESMDVIVTTYRQREAPKKSAPTGANDPPPNDEPPEDEVPF